MKLFASSTSYLGIDIGTASIKMVELENYKNQARLKTYGYADISTNVLSGAIDKNNQLIADYINTIAKKSNVQTRQVVAALPTFSVFNFIINLPPMPKKDLTSAIKWEAKKFIPVPIDEMILDWKILNKKKVKKASKKDDKSENDKSEEIKPAEENKGDKKPGSHQEKIIRAKGADKNYRILLTAAPKNLVARYIDIFKRAKLNLLSLETEAFALSRSLIGNDLSTVMIVDIGSTTADICLIEEGVPILNKGIDTGGDFITKAIMNSLNVNKERADQFKRDFGLSATGNKKIPDVIQQSLNSIINEIKYVFELYQRQGDARIDKIILTGGSAFLPNLPKYLSDLLNLPVIIGDPWDRIIYPLDLKPVLQEIGPRMATSIGLAMRDI
jgi:type IV pilus assembly protein PilM